jgi:MinD-like ATPase involved in chromosome partitioning or flagellar assembly
MPEYQEPAIGGIKNQGQQIPIVAFYSVQGGVGKSTLARKFAELVTVAPGLAGRKPNVLLIDLDMDSQGITFRLAQGLRENFRTVHEIIAERNIGVAQAISLTGAVPLTRKDPVPRGQLYLMPAAPSEAKDLFATAAKIDKDELIRLLLDMIKALVIRYDISCVIIDCAPGSNPYIAAAATLADVPLLIGRNEETTYKQIKVLPARFKESYPHQRAKQLVIINAVAAKEIYAMRAKQYEILDYIPWTLDVILDTEEGISNPESLRTLLFEKFIVDIIKKVFVGMNHLIPEAPEVLGQEWMEVLERLHRCEEAPKVRRLRPFGHLRWGGAGLVVIGLALIAAHQVFNNLPATLTAIGIVSAIVGVLLAAGGWYAVSQRQRILMTAQKLVHGGPDEVFRKLKEGASHRRELEEMKKLANTIPVVESKQE